MDILMDKIITDEDVLRHISKETTQEEVDSLNLGERLKEANGTAWTNGCGLSAIQIGVPLRFAWFIWKDKEHTLLNPEITMQRGSFVNTKEGCLSIPNNWANVKRYQIIEYTNNGKKCRAKGMKAVIIQHEIDHMNGILNTDEH
jgi:peptide deformylase